MITQTNPGATVSLTEGAGGVFEVTIDGRLSYSKKQLGRFPTDDELVKLVSA